MKFFIDTACIEEIRKAKSMGVLDGVTTNPSLIAREKLKAKRKFRDIVEEICLECDTLPVSVEVLAVKSDQMVAEGLRLAEIRPNLVVKLPCTEDGLKACHTLSAEGIQTNLTLCFSAAQALLVAKAGATYVSPFVGRLDDIGQSGMQLIADIKGLYLNYGLNTKILVASIRTVLHVLDAARIGADVATVPPGVISKLMEHYLTTKGLESFLEDARRASNPPLD